MIDTTNIPQPIADFVTQHSEKQISIEEFLKTHKNINSIHNHTWQNLFLYFDLEKHLKKNRVVFYPGVVFILDNRKHKFFIFDQPTFLKDFDFTMIPTDLYKKVIFYSSTEQEEPGIFLKSKLKEFVYDLDKVFDEQTYYEKYRDRTPKEIKKKIYNKIIYPFKWLSKPEFEFRVEDVTQDHIPAIEELHKKWCDAKIADPRTFLMMFSSNRYQRCIKMMYESSYLKRDQFFAKAFYLNNELMAIRQCALVGDRSFDIGFFGNFWSSPSQFLLYLNAYCLASLNGDYKVAKHNTGMVMSGSLEKSKNHFPGESLITYKYNFPAQPKIKEVEISE